MEGLHQRQVPHDQDLHYSNDHYIHYIKSHHLAAGLVGSRSLILLTLWSMPILSMMKGEIEYLVAVILTSLV